MYKTLCIVIPSQAYLEQAGARIRYMRLRKYYEDNGYLLCFSQLNDCLKDACNSHDVYIISKCYSSSAVVLAHTAKDAGKVIGVDLFDDYFSQKYDARFVRLRNWLNNLSMICDFALCSTENMKKVASLYFEESKIHILNDPIDIEEFSEVDDLLIGKKSQIEKTKVLNVVWFGMGDNPDFKVGLNDLIAFKQQLLPLKKKPFKLKLTVLTNLRSLKPNTLKALRSFGDSISIELWSEKAEKEILKEASVCFIPVNYQSFSTVKSLNRCVTAFTYGCQVLSPGFNLYSDLDKYVYRNVDDLICDLKSGVLKLNINDIVEFKRTLLTKTDPFNETKSVIRFLTNIELSKFKESEIEVSKESKKIPVVYTGFVLGASLPTEQIAVMQRTRFFMVGTPFSASKIKPHFRFQFDEVSGSFDFFVRSNFKNTLVNMSKNDVLFLGKKVIGKTEYSQVCIIEFLGDRLASHNWKINDVKSKLIDPSFILLNYKDMIELISSILNYFIDINLYLLEESKLSWRQPNLQNRVKL